MNTTELTPQDEELIEGARDVIEKRFVHGQHYVGSAVRTADGEVFTGVHTEANVGRASVCAEPVVLGTAVTEGATKFDTIVSVRHPGPNEPDEEIRVVSPCGICREFISDLDSDMQVILPVNDDLVKVNALELLPSKYVKSYRQVHLSE